MSFKKVPTFWKKTDFLRKITHVRSDHPDFDIIKSFDWSDKEFCDEAMDLADAYIKELKEGRINFRKPTR